MQDTGQLPQLTPTLPSPGRNKKKRLWVILAVLGATIVVVLGVSVYAFKTSTAKTNTASVCVTWESSHDQQVVDKDESNGFCNSTILIQPPQDGGVFSIDSAAPTHGSQVCSVSAYKSTDIIYQGNTGDSAEAENLCIAMKSAVNQGASNAASSTSPAAATPSAVVPSYSYQDGWDAAAKATYIDLEVASSQDQHGADIFTSQEDDNDWCINNDPNRDGTGGNNSYGVFRSGDSSVWYEGCMAELEAHPPKPPVITPNTPGYSEGYALGMKADPDPYGGPQEWCDVYADSDYTYAPGNGQDQNPEDDPAVVGCLAALRARGFQ